MVVFLQAEGRQHVMVNGPENVPRIMNIHPALLPSFPGVDGYGDTFRYGCRVGGCTVHFVDGGMDSGPIIGQKAYTIEPYETLDDILRKPQTLPLIYEVFYFCLNHGFRGKYIDNQVKINEYLKKLREKIPIHKQENIQAAPEETGQIKFVGSKIWYYALVIIILGASYFLLQSALETIQGDHNKFVFPFSQFFNMIKGGHLVAQPPESRASACTWAPGGAAVRVLAPCSGSGGRT